MHSPDGKITTVSGIYRAIEPRPLVLHLEAGTRNGTRGHETEVTVTFEPAPGGTRMVLVPQTFVDRGQPPAATSTAGVRALCASNAKL